MRAPAPPHQLAGPQAPTAFRPLTGELLLAAWEAGMQVAELRRPLALLATAAPGAELTALSRLPIAARNLALARLHAATFGPQVAVLAGCPECGERLEFALEADEVIAGLQAAATAGPVTWTEDGQRHQLRPVTTDDLAATLAIPDPSAAEDLLLARCLVPPPAARLPAEAAKRFEELNADAEIRCAIDCPACAARQVLDLDIARYLWREVAVAAGRLLTEVHALARAYGWPERDILRLSARRRAAYLELVGG